MHKVHSYVHTRSSSYTHTNTIQSIFDNNVDEYTIYSIYYIKYIYVYIYMHIYIQYIYVCWTFDTFVIYRFMREYYFDVWVSYSGCSS